MAKTPEELRTSGDIPEGYTLLPTPVVRDLIEAGYAAYTPAFGGSEERVLEVYNSAKAAENILSRDEQRNNESVPNAIHESHVTRSSDSSLYDIVCKVCGARDAVPGGLGNLVYPCKGKENNNA